MTMLVIQSIYLMAYHICIFFTCRTRTARNNQDYGDNHFSSNNERGRRRRTDDYDEAEPLDKRLRLDGNSIGKGSPMVIGPRIRPRLSSEDEEQRAGGGGRRVSNWRGLLIICIQAFKSLVIPSLLIHSYFSAPITSGIIWKRKVKRRGVG